MRATRLSESATRLSEAIYIRLSEALPGSQRVITGSLRVLQAFGGHTRLSEGATRLFEALPGSQRVLTGSLTVLLDFPMP